MFNPLSEVGTNEESGVKHDGRADETKGEGYKEWEAG